MKATAGTLQGSGELEKAPLSHAWNITDMESGPSLKSLAAGRSVSRSLRSTPEDTRVRTLGPPETGSTLLAISLGPGGHSPEAP